MQNIRIPSRFFFFIIIFEIFCSPHFQKPTFFGHQISIFPIIFDLIAVLLGRQLLLSYVPFKYNVPSYSCLFSFSFNYFISLSFENIFSNVYVVKKSWLIQINKNTEQCNNYREQGQRIEKDGVNCRRFVGENTFWLVIWSWMSWVTGYHGYRLYKATIPYSTCIIIQIQFARTYIHISLSSCVREMKVPSSLSTLLEEGKGLVDRCA